MHIKSRIAVFVLSIFLCSLTAVFAGPLEDCAEYAALGVPGQQGDLLCRAEHLLAHHPEYKTPLWVIERLTKEKATSKVVPRYNKFQADPGRPRGGRAELSDYRGSGYDRGHMAPSADMRWNKRAMVECFYLSNMVPQVGAGMNRGIWKDLEEYTRTWAVNRGELFVFTGPIYAGPIMTIGRNAIAVPSHLYKIIYDPARKEAIAFIMPNRPLNTADMPSYIVSVRDVEAATGLNFLSSLEQELQDTVETAKASSLWN